MYKCVLGVFMLGKMVVKWMARKQLFSLKIPRKIWFWVALGGWDILQPFDVSLLPVKLDCLFSKSCRSLSEQFWWNAEAEAFFCSTADPCNSARSRTTTSCTLPTIDGCGSADSGHVNFTLLLASLIVTIVYKSQRYNCLQDKGSDVCLSKLLINNETQLFVRKKWKEVKNDLRRNLFRKLFERPGRHQSENRLSLHPGTTI